MAGMQLARLPSKDVRPVCGDSLFYTVRPSLIRYVLHNSVSQSRVPGIKTIMEGSRA
jgi:hypothetical protein